MSKAKKITEQEIKKKKSILQVRHAKRRLKQKQANDGVLITGEQRINLKKDLKKNLSAKKSDQHKKNCDM